MSNSRRDKPILSGPFIMVYHLADQLRGDLPNEISFLHPVTKARAVYTVNPDSVVLKQPTDGSGN